MENKDEKKKPIKKDEDTQTPLYGISEAPKDHPDNINGKLKIILE